MGLVFMKSYASLVFVFFAAASLQTAPGAPAPPSVPEDLRKAVLSKAGEVAPKLEPLYKEFHAHPELSLHEEKTAQRVGDGLEQAGFAVTRSVGGNGVVGVLTNGPGRTVLVRTDLDALPVSEQTGAPYASTVKTVDDKGNAVGVMHACG